MKWKAVIAGFIMLAAIPAAMADGNFVFNITDIKGDVSDASIDIVKAWTTVEGANLVIHLQVSGNINEGAMYAFWFEDGSNSVGVIYSDGTAMYSGSSSAGLSPPTNVNGNTLTITVPYAGFTAGLNAATTSFRVVAQGGGEVDYASYEDGGSGGNGGNGGDENEDNQDPVGATPTDESISVKINTVKYKVEPAVSNAVKAYVYVDGTTNGADHVAVDFVIYYKNGTHDYVSWIVGPLDIHQAYGEYSIDVFFNSTSGNWNSWKYEMNMTYPTTQYAWLYDIWKGKSEVSKVVVYARAYKDEEETKWNQCKYETTPVFSADAVTYGMVINGGEDNNDNTGNENENSDNNGGSTPGFEMALLLLSMATVAIGIRKRKK